MEIRNFVHKSLKVPPDAVDKLRAMLTHQLGGDRKGVWSLHVTRNWRLTFQIKDGEILDVDYEDYH